MLECRKLLSKGSEAASFSASSLKHTENEHEGVDCRFLSFVHALMTHARTDLIDFHIETSRSHFPLLPSCIMMAGSLQGNLASFKDSELLCM